MKVLDKDKLLIIVGSFTITTLLLNRYKHLLCSWECTE